MLTPCPILAFGSGPRTMKSDISTIYGCYHFGNVYGEFFPPEQLLHGIQLSMDMYIHGYRKKTGTRS